MKSTSPVEIATGSDIFYRPSFRSSVRTDIILALSLITVFSVSAFAANPSNQEEIKIAEESYVDTVVDMLDKDWYGGVYYEGDTVHIIATEGNTENIQSIAKRTRNTGGVNTIVPHMWARME